MKLTAVLLIALVCFSSCKKDKDEAPLVDNSITWKLDQHVIGQNITYHTNFVAKEEAVAVLGRMDDTYQVKKVQFLFGGKDETKTITLKIYRDKEDGDMFPGPLLFENDYSISASEELLQEIDLTSNPVKVEGGGSIRVAIRFQHNGLPSIACDQSLDHEAKNLMNLEGNWVTSKSWNITGDWIIRAVVE